MFSFEFFLCFILLKMVTRQIFINLHRTQTNLIYCQRRNATDIAIKTSPLSYMVGSAWTTKLAEKGLLYFHDTLHLPWWVGIIGITFAVKGLLFPVSVIAIRSASKLPYVHALMEPKLLQLEHDIRIKGEEKNFSRQKINLLVRKAIVDAKRDVYAKNNCHPARPYPLFAIQIPVWLSVTFALRNLAQASQNGGALFYLEQHRFISELPLGFAESGFLWISSLAAPDPYFILPALLFAVNFCSFQLKRSDILMAPDKIKFKVPKTVTVTHVITFAWIPVVSYICSIAPSGIGLYWLFSSTIAFFISLLLKYPKPRTFLGILPSPLESKNPQPLKTFFLSFGRLFGRKNLSE